MIRKSYIDSQGKIVCPMNGANYLTLRGKLANWTSEDILKVVQENIDNIDIGDKGKEPWEPIEDNKPSSLDPSHNLSSCLYSPSTIIST